MLIRLENHEGIGVYQSDFLDECVIQNSLDLVDLFNFLGGVTRAPKYYNGAIPGHQCKGYDIEFDELMSDHTRFAWDLDFFKRMMRGDWSDDQKQVAENFNWTPFVQHWEYEEFIVRLAKMGINTILLDGEPLFRTEQQAIYDPNSMRFVDCLGVEDVKLLMD